MTIKTPIRGLRINRYAAQSRQCKRIAAQIEFGGRP